MYQRYLIQTITVGTATASIDFTSIPATYTDLCLKVSARSSVSSTMAYFDLKFNTSIVGWSGRFLYGTGSAAGSASQAYFGGAMPGANATASTFGNAEIYIPNYASSNYKSVSIDAVAENNATLAEEDFNAQLWSNTAAINAITLFPENSANFVTYSSASLYGIRGA